METGYVVVVFVGVIAVLVGLFVGRMTGKKEPVHTVFGVEQAESAFNYIRTRANGDDAQMKLAVDVALGVVGGALGIQNKVSDEVAEDTALLATENDGRDRDVSGKQSEIDALLVKIRALRVEIAEANARTVELKELDKIFGGSQALKV